MVKLITSGIWDDLHKKAPQHSTNQIQVTNCMCTLCSELEHDITIVGPYHIKGVNGYN